MADERLLDVNAPALKALAHPLRLQILRVLTLRKQVSVTGLAEELGETTGATSYHLRQLARHGFVEEADGDGPADGTGNEEQRTAGRRRQLWQIAVDRVHMTGYEFLANAATREAAGFVLREIQADRNRRMANWYATALEWSDGWQRASSDADMFIELNQKQTRALADDLAEVVKKYRMMKPGRGARMIDVQYAVFPDDDGTRA
jgi:DNA-binding transcriptional ArsR family regulator